MAKRKKPAAGKKTPAAAEKPKTIDIVSVKRGRRNVVIHWRQGDAHFVIDERDMPLPSFYKAFDALCPVAATICHLGVKYTQSGLRVVKMDMGEKGGTSTVALHCRKDIDDAAKEFAFKTPERMLAHPTQEGKYTPPLPSTDAALVEDMIEEAKRYVRGERAQGQIVFEKDEDDDESGEEEAGELLPLHTPAAPEAAAT